MVSARLGGRVRRVGGIQRVVQVGLVVRVQHGVGVQRVVRARLGVRVRRVGGIRRVVRARLVDDFAAKREELAFEMTFLVPVVPRAVAVNDLNVAGKAEMTCCPWPP